MIKSAAITALLGVSVAAYSAQAQESSQDAVIDIQIEDLAGEWFGTSYYSSTGAEFQSTMAIEVQDGNRVNIEYWVREHIIDKQRCVIEKLAAAILSYDCSANNNVLDRFMTINRARGTFTFESKNKFLDESPDTGATASMVKFRDY